MGVKIDIVVGQRPESTREMVLATEAFIREISDDPSEGVMTLLVTAVHIDRQHSPRTPLRYLVDGDAVKRLKKGGSAWGFDTAPANTRRRRRVADTTAPGGAGACMTRTARRRFTLQGEITLAANLSWQRVGE